jgi:hypothetical protein
MAKPVVPDGAIPLDADPPAIRLGSLRHRLKGLSDDPVLAQIQASIEAEDWATAVRLLAVISSRITEAKTAAVALINRINRKRYNPLLELDG